MCCLLQMVLADRFQSGSSCLLDHHSCQYVVPFPLSMQSIFLAVFEVLGKHKWEDVDILSRPVRDVSGEPCLVLFVYPADPLVFADSAASVVLEGCLKVGETLCTWWVPLLVHLISNKPKC